MECKKPVAPHERQMTSCSATGFPCPCVGTDCMSDQPRAIVLAIESCAALMTWHLNDGR